jgi:two-component system nitrate/nitrite response regulator NarL
VTDPSQNAARLLVVDDHAEVRTRLRRLLAEHWDVCGEAVDGKDAIREVGRLRPDLIVMDMFMPQMSGLEAAVIIHESFPGMPILLVTTLSAATDEAARRSGIRGTVSKMALDTLVPGVRALLRGEEFFSDVSEADR